MSYQEPTYEYRGSGGYEFRAPRADAYQTVRAALELMACDHACTTEERRNAQELLNRNDWTVYFP